MNHCRSTLASDCQVVTADVTHVEIHRESFVYSVSQKKSPQRFCGNFSKTVGNFSTKFYAPIVRSYPRYTTKFLLIYLQLSRSYAILSMTTQFTSCAQNVHHQPKHMLAFSPNSWEFLDPILYAY